MTTFQHRLRFLVPVYATRYGYPLGIALVAEFWWRVEHVGYYRGGDGGLAGRARCRGYTQRKRWECRGYAATSGKVAA